LYKLYYLKRFFHTVIKIIIIFYYYIDFISIIQKIMNLIYNILNLKITETLATGILKKYIYKINTDFKVVVLISFSDLF